jgi:hypothetical protein
MPGSGGSGGEDVPVRWRQEDNEVLLHLIRASLAWRPEIEDCYFVVTPALARVLKRFGIPLTPVGPKVQHRGTRLPFHMDVAAADAGMYETLSAYAAIAERSPPYQTYSRFFNDGAEVTTNAPGTVRWHAQGLALNSPPHGRDGVKPLLVRPMWATSFPLSSFEVAPGGACRDLCRG